MTEGRVTVQVCVFRAVCTMRIARTEVLVALAPQVVRRTVRNED